MPTTAIRRSAARRAPSSELRARDVMNRRIVTVTRSTPLSEVERLLSENRISGMPVVDARGRAEGVVSFHDLLDHYTEDPDTHPRRFPGYFRLSTEELVTENFSSVGIPPESEDTVEQVMTADVVDVPLDATLLEIAKKMADREVHRVLVTDEKGRLRGIVGSLALLAAFANGASGAARSNAVASSSVRGGPPRAKSVRPAGRRRVRKSRPR